MTPLRESFESAYLTTPLALRYRLVWDGQDYVGETESALWSMWQLARQDIVIELPNAYNDIMGISVRIGYKDALNDCEALMIHQGIKVLHAPLIE
jgi:hypothetical protein